MSVRLFNPATGESLAVCDDQLRDESGNGFPIVRGIPRLAPTDNYAESFGMQWNKFAATQVDRQEGGWTLSKDRFYNTTKWNPDELAGLDILEVGSGAGRFSNVVLSTTKAHLWSVDYSSAVDANWRNNGQIAPERFHLFQCSVYEMPFPDGSFDRAFCLGVLQHTPDFEASVRCIIEKVKVGGEIVVDFYPITGFWTKLHAKYLLRPLTRRIPKPILLKLIDRNVDWMAALVRRMRSVGLGHLARFIPVTDDRGFPADLSKADYHEWLVLDTFDWFSPEYDQPQTVKNVRRMFDRNGADVIFAGFNSGPGSACASVRATKRL